MCRLSEANDIEGWPFADQSPQHGREPRPLCGFQPHISSKVRPALGGGPAGCAIQAIEGGGGTRIAILGVGYGAFRNANIALPIR
jgi:hypothetical protein